MAVPDLSRLLETLDRAGVGDVPLQDAGAQIEMFAQADLDAARQAKVDGSIVNLVNTWYVQCRNARTGEERQWLKNIDMYQGRQFTVFDQTSNRMVDRPLGVDEKRLCINVLEPIIRTELAKTTSVHPRATVLPASNEQQDISAALAGEALWDSHYEMSEYQSETFIPANLWRALTGMGFGKMYYDPYAIDKQATEAAERAFREKNAGLAEQGIDITAMKPEPIRGAIMSEPVSPFHLFVPDLAQMSLRKQPYLIHAYLMPVVKAMKVYGPHVPDKDWRPPTVSSSEIVNLSHLGVKTGGSSAPDEQVLVLEAYVQENVTDLLPKGGVAIVAGGQLVALAKDGMPYDHGEYPFAMLSGIETGRFYRKSTIETLLPIQDEVNRFYNRIAKQRDLLANPMFYYDEGSFDPRRVRSKPGTGIPIRLGMRYPQPMPIQEVPQFVYQLMDRLAQHRDDISGQHQVSRAISPGADTAASALALLKETDDDLLSTTFDSIQQFTRTMARQFLSLVVQFWDEPRMVKVTGLDHSVDVRALKGSDIAGGTDVRIDGESVLPKSKAARAAQVTEWIGKGIIPPEVGLEAMEMGTLGRVYNRLTVDKDAARRENTEITKLTPEMIAEHQAQAQEQMQQMSEQVAGIAGAAPTEMPPTPPMFPVNWYDNHEIHFEEHRLFANSQAFKALPPEVQQILQEHAAEHEAKIIESMAAAAPAEDGGAQQDEPYDGSQPDMSGAPVA